MDQEMPELDGCATTRALRADETTRNLRRLPVLALTANAGAEDIAQCLTAGMDDHLAKPFDRHDLEEAMERLTKSKAA